MTGTELRSIEARAGAATAGPWTAHHRDVAVADDSSLDATLGGFLGWEIEGPPEPDRGQFERAADAHFIAAARSDVLVLVAEVRRLRAAILAVERLDCCHSHLYDRGEGLRRLQDELRADVDTRAARAV